MTKVENFANTDTKSGKNEKERSNKRSHKKEKQKPQTKIVIRHLPPTMTENEFLKQIDPLPPHDLYYYAAADWSLGYDSTCRAYITMKNYDDVFLFRDRFDGYVFVDSKGAEYPAIVEFAPFQGLIKNKSRRVDIKVNTIEQEPHYQQFIAKLEEEREAAKSECKLEFSLERKKEEKITSTPLLQYLANKKEKRREEAKRRQEEKRRQREEDKEKRKQPQTQVTKIISNHEAGCKTGQKTAGGKENVVSEKNVQSKSHEEGKSTRSQRRAERNQRRREEFERRRQEREQRDKGSLDDRSKRETKCEANESEVKIKEEQQQQASKSDDGKLQQRKEAGKRYSERRERERNRNRKDKDMGKDKEIREKENETKAEKYDGKGETKEKVENKNLEEKTANKSSKTESTSSDATKYAAVASTASYVEDGESSVSESVMNFIRSVTTAKEFVPKQKQQEFQDTKIKSSAENVAQINVTKLTDTKSEAELKNEINAESDTRTQKQRATEEQRRIRNKDRPSIAIYQPKPRLRMSEERDASSLHQSSKGDSRSNPTSDCESLKKEEIRNSKKVSRYSERRAERRNHREKHKHIADSIETEQKEEKRSASKVNEIND